MRPDKSSYKNNDLIKQEKEKKMINNANSFNYNFAIFNSLSTNINKLFWHDFDHNKHDKKKYHYHYAKLEVV